MSPLQNDVSIDWMRQVATIRRCHSSTVIGDYPIAIHCFNMINMYLILCPKPKVETIRELTMHDAGELITGDIYHWSKRMHGLGEAAKQVEDHARDAARVALYDLYPEDFMWISSLDLLEFYLFADDQLYIGNKHFLKDHQRSWKALQAMIKPAQVKAFIDRIAANGRQRVDRVELMEGAQ